MPISGQRAQLRAARRPVYNRCREAISAYYPEPLLLDVKRINEHVSVSPQIKPEDIPALKAMGFTTIVNNRPDGEAPDQPSSAVMQAAAEAAGLAYHYIPLGRDGVSPELVEQTRVALEGSDRPGLLLLPVGHALDDALGAVARPARCRPRRSSRQRRMRATTCPTSWGI